MGRKAKSVKPAYQIAIEISKKILEQVKQPLNPNQIYNLAIQKGYGKEITYGGKTPWQSFARDIYIDLRDNPKTIFEVVQVKPKLIQLKGQNIQISNVIELKETEQKEYKEEDLHALLTSFVFFDENWQVRTKTIKHRNSTKGEGGEDIWLYPDIVGVNFEYGDFDNEVTEFMKKYDKLPIKIYSFELKKELTVSNFRKCYFQAVSNSSWANEGYLVAAEIDTSKPELMDLIKRSNQSFSIGVIHLNIDELAQSEIIVPAQFREQLDYTVINELSKKNEDFNNFLKTIVEFDPNNKNRYKDEFDEAMNNEELEKYKKDNKIK